MALLWLSWGVAPGWAQPLIANASFETDPIPPGPGYGSISSWVAEGGITTGYGLNGASGPFADNGAIPDGLQVAFLQQSGILSQSVSGFKTGAQYWLTYRENARFACCGGTGTLAVRVDESVVVAEHAVISVGDTNPYRTVGSAVFTAPNPTLTVAFVKGGAGDVTALIDHVEMMEIPPGTLPQFTEQPQGGVVDAGEAAVFSASVVGTTPLVFQWRFNGMDLPGETNSTLTLLEVSPAHAGRYGLAARNVAGSAVSASVSLMVRAGSPALLNPSFERDPAPPYPGYGTITGWTPGGEIGTGYGINQANGAFADNGSVPHGTRVAFMQNNGALSQLVTGFTIGASYVLAYRENARANCCGQRFASLSVTVGGMLVVPEHTVVMVEGVNPYRLVVSDVFIAPERDLSLTFSKGGSGDSTVLLDELLLLRADRLELAVAAPNGSLTPVLLEGAPGQTVTLEYRDSFSSPAVSWQALRSFDNFSGLGLVLDDTVPISGARFYRARAMP